MALFVLFLFARSRCVPSCADLGRATTASCAGEQVLRLVVRPGPVTLTLHVLWGQAFSHFPFLLSPVL